MTAQEYLEEKGVFNSTWKTPNGEIKMSDLLDEFSFKNMKNTTGDLIQFVAVELRGEKISEEDVDSIIHDYIHPKK